MSALSDLSAGVPLLNSLGSSTHDLALQLDGLRSSGSCVLCLKGHSWDITAQACRCWGQAPAAIYSPSTDDQQL